MKILYLHQYFATPADAGGTRSYEFARRLASEGHQVDLVTTDAFRRTESTRPGWSHERIEGFTVHQLSSGYSNKMVSWRRIYEFLRFMLASTTKATRTAHDVVFVTSTPLTIAVPAIITSKFHGTPLVLEIRDVWPEVPISLGVLQNRVLIAVARWLERRAYASAESIVALSPEMASSIRGVNSSTPITVIPNGCDVNAPREVCPINRVWPAKPEGHTVLYAGTLGVANDIGYLLDVAAAAKRLALGLNFLIVGDGYERTKLIQSATRRGLLDLVRFVDPLPKTQLRSLLQQVSVAVSFFQDVDVLGANSPNKVFDALAEGVPVIVNTGGWLTGVLEETGAGVRVPAGDSETAAVTIGEFVTSPRRDIAANAAASLAQGKLSRDSQFKLLLQVLNGVMDHGNGRPKDA